MFPSFLSTRLDMSFACFFPNLVAYSNAAFSSSLFMSVSVSSISIPIRIF